MPKGIPFKTEEERIEARNANERARRAKDPEKFRAIRKKWRDKNKNYINEYRDKNREELNKKWREYTKNRKSKDPIYKFSFNTRRLIGNSFKRGKNTFKKNKKTEEILGCTIEFFIDYMLNLCPIGITLKDFGQYGYHIDHIIPISVAETEEDIIKLCHYTNLQPLWWEDNLQKSNKIL